MTDNTMSRRTSTKGQTKNAKHYKTKDQAARDPPKTGGDLKS